MKANLFLFVAALAFCGCNTTSFESVKSDGTRVCVSNSRLFWATENYSVTFGTNTATLTANKSNTDRDAIAAAVEAAVTAAIKAK